MSAYTESKADLKSSSFNISEANINELEPYTATRKILFLIMQRRKESFYQGIIKLKTVGQKQVKPEGKSLCLLAAGTSKREFFFNLVKKDSFEAFIVFVILISTFSLIF